MTALKQNLGDLGAFQKEAHPGLQAVYGRHPASAFGNDAPELVLLDAAYGPDSSVVWLMPQLFAVGEYAGVRDKMDDVQVTELARTIRSSYGHLTVTELMLFFHRFKAGCYGRFYGAADPLVITTALHDHFLAERDKWLGEIENERRHEQEKQERERRKGKILKPNEVETLRKRLDKEWEEQQSQQ